jgi:hypothetical protein
VLKKVTIVILIIAVIFLNNVDFVYASCNPPSYGDWLINSSYPQDCSNQEIVLNGDLIVNGSATLTFDNVTLLFNLTSQFQYSFITNETAILRINNSVFDVYDFSNGYYYETEFRNQMDYNNSYLENNVFDHLRTFSWRVFSNDYWTGTYNLRNITIQNTYWNCITEPGLVHQEYIFFDDIVLLNCGGSGMELSDKHNITNLFINGTGVYGIGQPYYNAEVQVYDSKIYNTGSFAVWTWGYDRVQLYHTFVDTYNGGYFDEGQPSSSSDVRNSVFILHGSPFYTGSKGGILNNSHIEDCSYVYKGGWLSKPLGEGNNTIKNCTAIYYNVAGDPSPFIKLTGSTFTWIFDDYNNYPWKWPIYTLGGYSINGNGAIVNNTKNLTLDNITFQNGDYAVYIENSTNVTIKNSQIQNNSQYDIYFNMNSYGNLVLNTSFDQEKFEVLSGSDVTVKWYLDTQVINQTSGPVENANVTGYNVSDMYVFSNLTDSNGYIKRQTLQEFWQNDSTIVYSTPYTVNTTKEEHLSSSILLNITESIFLQIILQAELPPEITDILIIPENPSSGKDLYCNFTASDADSSSFYVNLTWYKNETHLTTWDKNDEIINNNTVNIFAGPTKMDTSPGELWTCQTTVFDNIGFDIKNATTIIKGGG